MHDLIKTQIDICHHTAKRKQIAAIISKTTMIIGPLAIPIMLSFLASIEDFLANS